MKTTNVTFRDILNWLKYRSKNQKSAGPLTPFPPWFSINHRGQFCNITIHLPLNF